MNNTTPTFTAAVDPDTRVAVITCTSIKNGNPTSTKWRCSDLSDDNIRLLSSGDNDTIRRILTICHPAEQIKL